MCVFLEATFVVTLPLREVGTLVLLGVLLGVICVDRFAGDGIRLVY